MNLTLGTLAELKTHVLTPALREGTDYDAMLANIGRGVADLFEGRCNRKFARVVGDTFECSANRDHLVLPRYPVETVTKIEARTSLATGWVDLGAVSSIVKNIAAESGIVWFETEPGDYGARLRLAYTGGYWFDETADGAVDVLHTFKQGSIALAQGAESEVIDFSQTFAAADSDVVVNVSVVLPAGGIGITVNPSAVTAEGFTAVLGFPVPASGYTLRWSASIETQGALPSESMPAGATARPPALFLAWLQQCAAIWRATDVLGTGIAEKPAIAAIANADLLPAVVPTLNDFTRHTLL